jgi:TonB-linked SusC/RagA family outer membrane protein
MQYNWTKQLSIAWLGVLVLISQKLLANPVPNESHVEAISTQSMHVQQSIKLDELLSVVSKKEKVYFAYADNVLKNQKIEGVNVSSLRLDRLNVVLERVGLKAVKISVSQYIIEPVSTAKLTDEKPKDANKTGSQQQKRVRGLVQDSNGNPLLGVTVKKSDGQGTTRSDATGIFMIDAVSGEKLIVSFLGYETRTIEIPPSGDLIITMQELVSSLEEVVVVGYGTQKKSDLTGAVGVVDVNKSLKSRPVTNVQELLAGTIPGLNVSKGSGAVGSGATINIRGTSTIGGSSGALVLIDGVPGNINTLNPNDIESISTLKDAASASIYGSRAANGVILITTKSGQALDKLTVELNSSVGVQSPQFQIDFVGAEDFMKLYDQALVNDGKAILYGEQGLENLRNGKYADIKWYEEIYKRNALINNNYLAFSGNTEKMKYRFSASHDYQDGTLPNNNYNRIIFKPDMTFKISEKIIARANIQYTETYIHTPQGGVDIWQSQATRIAPINFITNTYGQYGPGSAIANNPIAGAHESGYNKQKYKELMSIFEFAYKPIQDLELKGNFSRYTYDNWSKNRVLTYELYNEKGEIASVQNRTTSLTDGVTNSYRNMLQFTADYMKALGNHNIKLLGGFSQEYFNTAGFSAFRDNLPFSNVDVLNSGSETNMRSGGDASDVAIQSLFARLNYDYKGKYLFQANIRGDGSSRFAKGHRWGVFPSFSAGWNIHQEDFFHSELITSLKLRGSWGILGDAEKVGNYATAAILTYNPAMYGFNGVVVPGAWNNVAINPNISWEESKQSNFGVDLGLVNKINLSVEYFINDRDKILYAPPVPSEFGLTGPLDNLLKLRSSGLEVLVGYRDQKNDWSWGVDFNTSFSNNKVKDLAGTGPWIGGQTYSQEGYTFNLPYGYQAIGLFQSEDEIKKSASQGVNIFPGNIRYKDQNNDGIINGDDRVILRDKPIIRFGMNLNVGWRSLDASANFYGALQNARYISGYEGWAFFLTQNARPMHIDNWTGDNPDASYPRLSLQNTSNDQLYSDYWLRKANYLKIQNVQVGYTFPQQLTGRLKLGGLRAFVSGQNLATISDYPGFDPEGGYYPLSRTFSFGVNLTF